MGSLADRRTAEAGPPAFDRYWGSSRELYSLPTDSTGRRLEGTVLRAAGRSVRVPSAVAWLLGRHAEGSGPAGSSQRLDRPAITRCPRLTDRSQGTYYWGGFFSTDFWIDPQEKLIGILLTQTRPYDPHDVLRQFRVLATSAIVE
jgi:CubicO group peptidase (beta-lactamase class C family)